MIKLKRFYKDIYFHIFPTFSSVKEKVIFQNKIFFFKSVLLSAVRSCALPKTLNSAESGQLYSKQNLQPNGFLTVSASSFTLGNTTPNSSCPYDFNHSGFWNHNPLSPLFYSLKSCLSKLMRKFFKGWTPGNAESRGRQPIKSTLVTQPFEDSELRQLASPSEKTQNLWWSDVNVSGCLTRNAYLQIPWLWSKSHF